MRARQFNHSNKHNPGLLFRLKLAWLAFTLLEFEVYFPYVKGGKLVSGYECDNIRRKSNCQNEATTCLQNPVYSFKNEMHDHYHVCDTCAKKYIGTESNGEEWL